jgi:hypothetical protein
MRYPRTLCVWSESIRLRYEKSFIVYILCLQILYGKFVLRVCFVRKKERERADIHQKGTRYEYMIVLHEFMSMKRRKSCVLCVCVYVFFWLFFPEFIYEIFMSNILVIFKVHQINNILSSITELLSQRTVMCNLFS